MNDTELSFAQAGMERAYYCCALATDYGVSRIGNAGLPLTVRAGNILHPSVSAVAPDSLVWPNDNGTDFLETVCTRAGIAAEAALGFHGLGLTIGIDGRVPDATLPIFLWDRNGWNPLFRNPT